MRLGAQRDLELIAEDQVLEREIPPRSNGSKERMQGKPKQFCWEATQSQRDTTACNSRRLARSRVAPSWTDFCRLTAPS